MSVYVLHGFPGFSQWLLVLHFQPFITFTLLSRYYYIDSDRYVRQLVRNIGLLLFCISTSSYIQQYFYGLLSLPCTRVQKYHPTTIGRARDRRLPLLGCYDNTLILCKGVFVSGTLDIKGLVKGGITLNGQDYNEPSQFTIPYTGSLSLV